jgi:hypothetical protein
MTSERAATQPEDGRQLPADPGQEPAATGLEEVYSEDEAEVIAERLAALGYIE